MAKRFVVEKVDRTALCDRGLSEWEIPDDVDEITLVIHDSYVKGAQESERGCNCGRTTAEGKACKGRPSDRVCQDFIDEGGPCWWWPEYEVKGDA